MIVSFVVDDSVEPGELPSFSKIKIMWEAHIIAQVHFEGRSALHGDEELAAAVGVAIVVNLGLGIVERVARR